MSFNSTAAARLRKDYVRIMKDPVPFIIACPLTSNILEWHYAVRGPTGSVYEGGVYHGKLVFPADYPFRPPSIYMLTPNGRFSINTRLCLSISDYHPDTWNPAWSVSTILTGLLSFMLESSPTLGSIETTDTEKRVFARKSAESNLKSKLFCDLFPEIATELREKVAAMEEERKRLNVARLVSSTSDRLSSTNGAAANGGIAGSVLSNLLVLVGVAVFAATVRWVLRTVA